MAVGPPFLRKFVLQIMKNIDENQQINIEKYNFLFYIDRTTVNIYNTNKKKIIQILKLRRREILYYTLIKNAQIMDASCNTNTFGNILIKGDKIVPYSEEEIPENCQVIDAKGNLVVPGLIDFHTHIAYGLGDTGIHADLMAIPNGITAAVDAGSTGTAAFEGFVRYVIPNSEITIKAFLNVSAIGVTTEQHTERTEPGLYDVERIHALFERYYPQYMLGLKIRMGKAFTRGQGMEPLIAAKRISKELKCPLCVHLTDSEFPFEKALELLEKDDILCHCYQGQGAYSILDSDSRVLLAAREARQRGVIFDMAAGRINYNLHIMKKAIEDGFLPDIISTDTVATSVYQHKLFHLLYVMSYALDAGIPLMEVIKACTVTPAAHMGLAGKIGTLQPGANADISILKLEEHPITFKDQYGNQMKGNHLFLPLATLKAGRVVYKRIEFEFLS